MNITKLFIPLSLFLYGTPISEMIVSHLCCYASSASEPAKSSGCHKQLMSLFLCMLSVTRGSDGNKEWCI